MISAQQAYDLPDPTGPMMPRTKAFDCRNFQTIGLVEKSRFSPVVGNALLLDSLVFMGWLYVDDFGCFHINTNDTRLIGFFDGI